MKEKKWRLLHGKCSRTISFHEFSSIRKRTSKRSELASESSDTTQIVNSNRAKHFPRWNLFILLIFIGTEIFLLQRLQTRESKQNDLNSSLKSINLKH